MSPVGLGGILVLVAAGSSLPPAADRFFPADAGIVDVRRDFGAKGDGRADDTEALRRAVAAGIEKTSRYLSPAFVYLPRGTYLVTGPVEGRVERGGWSGGWRAGMILVGESRQHTVIRLADRAEGYGDPKRPRYVVATGSESDHRGDCDGGGNRAFRNAVMNLTIDTGRGNPGAIALDFVANNRGTVEDVVLRSGDGSGYCGLSLERHWPGPALVKRVAIEGFDYAIRAHHYQYSMTFEHLLCSGQRRAAIRNTNNALFFRDLTSRNSVPVFEIEGGHSFVVVVDGSFSDGAAGTAALSAKGKVFLRNVRVSGYASAVDDPSARTEKDGSIREFALGGPASLFEGPKRSLELPVKETPEIAIGDLAQWESVTRHGATPAKSDFDQEGNQDDDAPAIQAAIDSGKPVVYLPNGYYRVRSTIVLRGRLRKLVGVQSAIGPGKGNPPPDPLVRFEGGSGEAVVLEHLSLGGAIEHRSAKALAIRHCDFDGYRTGAGGTGDVFFEDTIGKPILVKGPQRAWGRQVNCEFGDRPLIENHGGTLWLLGLKTEGEMTCIVTVRGATELLGALLYPLGKRSPKEPAFVNDEGRVSLTYCWNETDYPVHVRERRGGEWRELKGDWKTLGRGPALYAGSPEPGR